MTISYYLILAKKGAESSGRAESLEQGLGAMRINNYAPSTSFCILPP